MAVAQEIIAITSSIVNAFIIRGERSIIIDTGVPGFGSNILAGMQKKGIKPGDISLILITHGHHDHYGSLGVLKEKTGAPVAVHKADAGPLKTGINPELHPIGAKGKFMVSMSKFIRTPDMKGVEADILIENEMDLGKYGVAGKAIHTPGHTTGSLSVVLDDGSVFIGDMIFGGFIRQKTPNFPYICQDTQALLKSVQAVFDLKPKIIYASHGGPFTPEAVRRKFFG